MNHMQIRNNWSKTTYQVSAKTSPDKNTSNVFSKIDKYYYIVNPGKGLCAAANNLRYLSPQSHIIPQISKVVCDKTGSCWTTHN